MSELSTLVKKQLISREDPDYYPVRNYLRRNKNSSIRFLSKFGWTYKLAPEYISLNKKCTSYNSEGIPDFKDKIDYYLFTIILSYAAEKGSGKFFIFEELIEYIKAIRMRENIDIPMESRKGSLSLYRTMIYLERKGYLVRLDGNVGDILTQDVESIGLLYRITGLYKSFDSRKKEDVELSSLQSLYQKLYSSPAVMICPGELNILRQHRDDIERDFCDLFDQDVSLIYTDRYAYINHNEGNYFPNENNRKDWLVLRVNGMLKKYSGNTIGHELFEKILDQIRVEDSVVWTKEMVLWGNRQYKTYVLNALLKWNFVSIHEDKIYVNPIVEVICVQRKE